MGHSSTIPTHFTPVQGIFLVLSNLLILFPVWAAFHRRAYLEAPYYMGVGIISSLYHVCASGFWCFAPEEVMATWDHIFAQGGIAVIIVWVLAFDAPRYMGRRVIEQLFTFVALFAIITLTVITDRESVWTLVWIIGSSVAAVFLKFLVIDHGRVYVHDYNWYFLVVGSLWVLVGLSLYFIGTTQNYWWTHAVWHMFVFIGIGFMILGRTVKVDRRLG